MPPRRKTATNQGDRPGPGTALSGRRVSLAVQNTSEWEQVNTAISTTVRGHIPSAEDVEKQRVLSHYCIGYVCFQWGGPGSVDGYFPSSTDPNIRINPRPINPDALSKLLVSIARTGVRDRANPIFAKIKRSSIPEHLLPQISSVNVADLTVPIPLLDIKRRLPERERELELELLTEYRDGNLLSEEELERARDELDDLRNERKAEDLVKLVNGQHRMQVMNLRWTEVNERRVELINQVKRNEFDGDLVKEWEIINNLISGLKYTVKLFDDDTPEHLLVELAENEDAKPMAPASGGEKIWAACSKQETNINKLLLSHKIKDRVEGLNMLNGMKERRIEFGQSISYDEERLLKLIGKVPNAPAPIPVKRGKGDGEDSILEGMCGLAMGHPATMEMACDTRYILPIWSKRIKESHVKAMIKDLGASFIAHVWLGLLYAHRICAIDHGVGFEEAKEFIHRNEKLGLDRSGAILPINFINLSGN